MISFAMCLAATGIVALSFECVGSGRGALWCLWVTHQARLGSHKTPSRTGRPSKTGPLRALEIPKGPPGAASKTSE